MGLSDLYGEPWHIEHYHREEGDEKRHRSKCCYYNKETKYCSYYLSKCYGASHCNYYKVKESLDELNKKIKKENTKTKTKVMVKAKQEQKQKEIYLNKEEIGIRKKLTTVGTIIYNKQIGSDGQIISIKEGFKDNQKQDIIEVLYDDDTLKEYNVNYLIKGNLIKNKTIIILD